MKTFTDNAGRTWTVTVNIDTIKRVKALLEVNLLEVVDGKLLERMISDPVLLCDVIYCICKPEADALSVSDADFGKAMAGDAIELATTALLEELCDFFPTGRRNLLRKALEKLNKLQSMALSAACLRIESNQLDLQMQAQLRSLLGSDTGDSSSNLPASSV